MGAARGRQEAAALALLLLLALGWLLLSLRLPLWEFVQPGPGLFPAIAAGLAAVCAAAALVFTRRDLAMDDAPEWRRLLVYLSVVLLWPFGFAPAGFVLSSLVALTLLLRLGERMGWLASCGFAALATGAGWLLFARLLGVPLP
jgi:putative tricarboxylic transport membrane protein